MCRFYVLYGYFFFLLINEGWCSASHLMSFSFCSKYRNIHYNIMYQIFQITFPSICQFLLKNTCAKELGVVKCFFYTSILKGWKKRCKNLMYFYLVISLRWNCYLYLLPLRSDTDTSPLKRAKRERKKMKNNSILFIPSAMRYFIIIVVMHVLCIFVMLYIHVHPYLNVQ